MTTTTSTNSAAQAIYSQINQGSSIANNSSTSSSSSTSDAQSRFLTLLTAQLKNQDPLNPMDNAQMTSQLAQISTVDGIERLNATLQTLLSGAADTQAMTAAALVGQPVLVPGSSLKLAGGKAYGGIDLSGPADSVTATIKDANGLTVRTLNLGSMSAGVNSFTWDGTTDTGATAADGSYSVSIAAKQGSNSVSNTVLSLGAVTSISRNGQNMSVNVGTLGAFAMADIRQIF